jgi:hypothetical protein
LRRSFCFWPPRFYERKTLPRPRPMPRTERTTPGIPSRLRAQSRLPTGLSRATRSTGIGYSRTLARNGVLALSYTPQLVPAAMLSQPVLGNGHWAVQHSIPPFTHTETTYGAGASPVGLELRFRPNRDLQPLVGTDEGFLYFSRNVPAPFAAQFNFTVEVRLGLRFRLDHGRAVSLEYIYHHLSNGYRAPQNPGVDSQMLCVGYVRRLRRS